MSSNQYKLEKYLRKYKETNEMKYLDKVMYYLKVGGESGSSNDNACKQDNNCDPTTCIRYEFGDDDVCRGNDVLEKDVYAEWKATKTTKGVKK